MAKFTLSPQITSNPSSQIIIGTRGSRLALAQSQGVLQELSGLFPEAKFELKVIKTRGDMMIGKPLSKIGGKGLFVKEIEQAMLRGEIDLAVHSLKDLPTEMPKKLTLGAITKREDPRDVLVTSHQSLVTRVKKIGTSSLRRKAQLLAKWPEIEVVDLRGNLDTRIRKLREGIVDAIVVAAAGLKRLKLEIGNWTVPAGRQELEIRSLGWMLPAPGQGALVIECRKDDSETLSMLKRLNHRPTELAVTAERALLYHLGGGCLVPIGAYARVKKDKLELEGLVAGLDGREVVRTRLIGDKSHPQELGSRVAEKLKKLGAMRLLMIS